MVTFADKATDASKQKNTVERIAFALFIISSR